MRLLVSVANAAEASAALAGGADLIDAKDPATGALTPVTADVFREIHACGRRCASGDGGDWQCRGRRCRRTGRPRLRAGRRPLRQSRVCGYRDRRTGRRADEGRGSRRACRADPAAARATSWPSRTRTRIVRSGSRRSRSWQRPRRQAPPACCSIRPTRPGPALREPAGPERARRLREQRARDRFVRRAGRTFVAWRSAVRARCRRRHRGRARRRVRRRAHGPVSADKVRLLQQSHKRSWKGSSVNRRWLSPPCRSPAC